ncbi:hypothetical protein KSP40_PGU006099 [Platanthera guangdongensis]|uniref:Uncharacterized protein n=1 Tax=Platanthera guangdongensis TaxID=2320717 RepID=A0ABR2N2K2_9ASPA
MNWVNLFTEFHAIGQIMDCHYTQGILHPESLNLAICTSEIHYLRQFAPRAEILGVFLPRQHRKSERGWFCTKRMHLLLILVVVRIRNLNKDGFASPFRVRGED